MYSVWLNEDQQRLWRDYLTMTSRLQAAMNRQLQADCGLSLADYEVLVVLDERPGCRMNELGDRLGWEQSRVSHQLRRMTDRALVARHGAEGDRRGVTVDITDSGREALTAAAPGHVALVRAVLFDGMNAGQSAAVGRWLARALERLDETD
ncbi:MarR family winged helix-turn-helix transcriptional regulator [Mycolicibacterium sp. J2]|uniref:MarR family winged helix-turn-helix transcriptional regulator n=1 Tax=Mycolicibacterium sp. J2 TaxID=2993511 RepID=UPI00224A7FE0|nr:MarR family winged helix-turn-helix transcriptional regulator [Mycolicibacterium sp. J2]MCX2713020.1 MarR family winged helix-turn-helix transcriptional regulator [Mycolicibacterium sp. J2]